MIVERRALILGSDPTRESRFNPDGSINQRAVWKEYAIFYKGPIKTREIKGKSTAVYGFADLQRDFGSDGQSVYSICTFLHYGLRNVDTYEEYGSSHFGGDPIHAYRTALCMGQLPKIGENPLKDWVIAYHATQQVYKTFDTSERKAAQARKKISRLIGQEKMVEILEAIPDDLEEVMTRMEEGYAWVDVKTLIKDIGLGRIQLSKFYVDIARRSRQSVLGLADQLNELEQ